MSSRRYHMIMDCENCKEKLISDKPYIKGTVFMIAKAIKMTIIHGPVVVEGAPDNPGITAFAIVDFSHISVHTFTKTGELCLDIFSCKPFSYKDVYEMIKGTFKLKDENIRRGVVSYNDLPKL